MEKKYNVFEFRYNGFTAKVEKNTVVYTAIFLIWTQDPGIGIFECSDGNRRYIPSCALVNYKHGNLPKQRYKDKIMYGTPCTHMCKVPDTVGTKLSDHFTCCHVCNEVLRGCEGSMTPEGTYLCNECNYL